MNVLEKIFEEIEDHAIEFESFGMCDDYVSVGWVKEVIRSHMDDGKDINVNNSDAPYITLTLNEDGVAEVYDDTYDVTVHCESEEEQERVVGILERYPGWIPVEDELPKETEKEYYPVMYVTTSYGVVAWGFYRVKDEQWYLYNDIMEEFESVENNKIIAWQPLPEPYRSEESKSVKNTQQETGDFGRDK